MSNVPIIRGGVPIIRGGVIQSYRVLQHLSIPTDPAAFNNDRKTHTCEKSKRRYNSIMYTHTISRKDLKCTKDLPGCETGSAACCPRLPTLLLGLFHAIWQLTSEHRGLFGKHRSEPDEALMIHLVQVLSPSGYMHPFVGLLVSLGGHALPQGRIILCLQSTEAGCVRRPAT